MQTLATLKRRVMAKVGKALAPQVTMEELVQAVNGAIDEVRAEMPYHIDPDESITLAESTYEYSLVGLGFAYVHRITVADADGKFPDANIVCPWMWHLLPGPKLKFDDRTWVPYAGRVIRIEGQAFQDNLTNDTDICYISDAFVVAHAAASLLGGLGSPREALMLRAAEDARQRAPFSPMPASVLVRS